MKAERERKSIGVENTFVENITDEADIVARQPKGARPNKARTATLGVRYTF